MKATLCYVLSFWDQLIMTAIQAEFEDICEEAQIWTKLHDLEQLCQEQGLLDGGDNSTRYDAHYLKVDKC